MMVFAASGAIITPITKTRMIPAAGKNTRGAIDAVAPVFAFPGGVSAGEGGDSVVDNVFSRG